MAGVGPSLWQWALASVALAVATAAGLSVGLVALVLAVFVAPLALPGVPGMWIFAGPSALLVWTVVLVVGGGPAFTNALAWVARRPSPALPFCLAVAWLGVAGWNLMPVAVTGDAPHYLTTAQSLVNDRDVDLRNNYDAATYRDFYGGSLEPRHTARGAWGEEYPFHGLGVSILVTPAYAAWGVAGATATLVVALALGASLLWSTALLLTSSVSAAWFAWAALLVSAPYTLHAGAVYPDGPAAAALAAALWLLVRLRHGPPVPYATLVAASVSLAVLPWLHVRLALPAGVFGIAVGWAILRRQPDPVDRLLCFMTVPTISCAGWFAASFVMFGTWNPLTAMLTRGGPSTGDAVPGGLFGMLADQEFGLIPIAPVFLAAPVAWWRCVGVAPSLAVSTGLAVAGTFFTSSLWVWWGGHSAAGRFITPLLPAMALWLACQWAATTAGGRRALGLGLGVSAGLTALVVLVGGGGHAYGAADGRGAIFEALSPVVNVAMGLPALFRPGASLATEMPLALAWLGASLAAAFCVARVAPTSLARSAVVTSVVLALAPAAAMVSWAIREVDPWTPGIAQHRLVAGLSRGRPAFSMGRPGGLELDIPLSMVRLRTPENVVAASPVLLHVPDVPAGIYAVGVRAGQEISAESLTLLVGRNAEPYLTWPASARPPMLALVRDVHSVRVTGSASAASDAWLMPVAIRVASLRPARRVTHMGQFDVYAFDDSSFAEGGGLWVRGSRSTSLVVAAAVSGGLAMKIQAGDLPVRARVEALGHRHTFDLAAGGIGTASLGAVSIDTPVELTLVTDGGSPVQGARLTFGSAVVK